MAKKIIIAAIAILVGFMGWMVVGCDRVENDKYTDSDKIWCVYGFYCRTKVVEIEGHKYIIIDGSSGCGIIHAASCECMNK